MNETQKQKLTPEEQKKLTKRDLLSWALLAIGAAIVIGWGLADFSMKTISGIALAAGFAAVVVYKNHKKK